MVTQQVIAPPTRAAMFLTVMIDDGAEEAFAALVPDLSGLTRSESFRSPDGEVNCVVGFGAQLWDRLYGRETRPLHLHPFQEIRDARHHAPATAGDLLIHVRAARIDLCFELACIIVDRLEGIGRIVDEVHGFKCFDERDLLGFVDGTENPEGAAAVESVTIGDEDPAYAGGSYVIVQKYTHDVSAWQAISIEEQERVIGRSKLDDVEMADDVKPANSHVALNTIEEPDGTQKQIMRANMPFGSLSEGLFGTYFIGYSADPAVTEETPSWWARPPRCSVPRRAQTTRLWRPRSCLSRSSRSQRSVCCSSPCSPGGGGLGRTSGCERRWGPGDRPPGPRLRRQPCCSGCSPAMPVRRGTRPARSSRSRGWTALSCLPS